MMNNSLPDPDPNTIVAPAATGRRTRSTTFGVAAGLLAGGAVGLIATVPTLTSAANDDGGAEVQQEVQQVLQQDDTVDPADDGENGTERPEPGSRLRETLQALVDDGTIDATQADAVVDHLVENRPDRGNRRGRRGLDHHRGQNEMIAELLGMDREALRSELAAGNSIADVAEANGVDVQTVIDALVADAESHLDLAIEHGLDEEAAATRLERITERITDLVNRTRPTDG